MSRSSISATKTVEDFEAEELANFPAEILLT
jgi:hypothetical protein